MARLPGLHDSLRKFSAQLRAGVQLDGALVDLAGNDNVESLITRDRTLEEAYVSILR